MTLKPANFPAWMKKAISPSDDADVTELLRRNRINTVCLQAACPNRHECYRRGTATFLIMGSICTRNCAFCDIANGEVVPLDADEPRRVAQTAKELGLKFVVLTCVTRDDLPDGGAEHVAQTIRAVRDAGIDRVEALVSDFEGRPDSVRKVVESGPVVFNHNVETVQRLYPTVRPQADYDRSLFVLREAAKLGALTKSGIMVGLGEQPHEVLTVFRDLVSNGVRILTIGQYLAPSAMHHPVKEFAPPARFEWYRHKALEAGMTEVASGPFVRSSYMAETVYEGTER
ncbi:MAG: lipoyl synthase [Planctomycetota bacterium]|nr:lipoyl synthase [Planctomycetota bacterium]